MAAKRWGYIHRTPPNEIVTRSLKMVGVSAPRCVLRKETALGCLIPWPIGVKHLRQRERERSQRRFQHALIGRSLPCAAASLQVERFSPNIENRPNVAIRQRAIWIEHLHVAHV